MKSVLTDKQKKLVVSLRNNGREKINAIAEKHSIPISTMANMLSIMERKDLIGHNCSVNFEEIGFPVRMLIALKTDVENRRTLQEYLQDCKNVNTLNMVNGGQDFHLETIFKNQKDAQDFLNDLESNNIILEKKVYNVIDTIHRDNFLTQEEHFE